jgi:hypothetical protein
MRGNSKSTNERRKNVKHQGKYSTNESRNSSKASEKPRYDQQKGALLDHPQWVAPSLGQKPLPKPMCPYCGKPIYDITSALSDKDSDSPVHFDCVIARIAEGEHLEKDEKIIYLGGGRFGIVQIEITPIFVKKIVQWEDKEDRAPWRKALTDNFSTV